MAGRAITPLKKPKQKPASSIPSQHTEPSQLPIEERVRQRAYELYLRRGGQDGTDMDDWLQAEEEIRQAEEKNYLSQAEGEGFIYRE
jgi:hypothetical protein